jgi:hypothetical protein
MKERLRVFDLRTVPMLAFALFYTSTQTPTENYIQLWHGDVRLLQQSLEVIQRTAAVIPRGYSPEVAGSQPSRQAPPDTLVIN